MRVDPKANIILSKDQFIYVQPALFDKWTGGERYRISEAAQGGTALGVGTGWETMGHMDITEGGKVLGSNRKL
jgi:hypothetical protein